MWRELVDRLLGFFFPDRCIGCGMPGTLLCPICSMRIRPYPVQVRRFPESLAGVFVGYVFEGVLQTAVHQLKYRRVRRVAQPLGALLATQLAGDLPQADALIPVPLHTERLRQRGYNQAEEIARALAQASGLRLQPTGLARKRATARQAELCASARAHNLEGAFEWVGPDLPPARVLLVDDVFTTGATMGACAEALRSAGCQAVYAVALARSRPDLDA